MSSQVETETSILPNEWTEATLEELCEPPQYGYTASASESGNVRFLRITDITDSGVNWLTVPFCECPVELLEKYRLTSGDIVFARIGATTGKSHLISDSPSSVFASYLIRVRAREKVDPAFLSNFFRSESYWRQINAQKNANLKKGVSGSLLKTLLVPVPSLFEQRKIVAVLRLVRRAIEQQERLIALTTGLKKSLMHKLFTKGLRGEPQKQTEIGLVPESWEVLTLESLLREPVKNGHSAKATNNGSGIRTLTLTAVTQRDFSKANTKLTSADSARVKIYGLCLATFWLNEPTRLTTLALPRCMKDQSITPSTLT